MKDVWKRYITKTQKCEIYCTLLIFVNKQFCKHTNHKSLWREMRQRYIAQWHWYDVRSLQRAEIQPTLNLSAKTSQWSNVRAQGEGNGRCVLVYAW